MEDIDALITKLKSVRQGILDDGIEVAKEMALSHKAQVVRRIQAEGIPGAKYSDKGVPAHLIEKSGYARLNSGFDRLIKDKKEKAEKVAWKDVRYAQGLQTEFVDYTFTGRTFKNLSIVDVRIVGGSTAVADLGGSEQEVKDKLRFGFARYGDFLSPNVEEKKLLLQLVEDKMNQIMQKYKLV